MHITIETNSPAEAAEVQAAIARVATATVTIQINNPEFNLREQFGDEFVDNVHGLVEAKVTAILLAHNTKV